MYIYWLGESSFKIKTDDAVVIIDPAHRETGLPQTTLEGHIVLDSHTLALDMSRVKPAAKETPLFTITGAGEYEVHGVFVYGMETKNKSLVYLVKAEDIQIAHLAGVSGALTDRELELFEGANIVLVPVGGKGVLDGKQADQVVSQIEPSIVIPMNYNLPRLTKERLPVDTFLLEMGAKGLEAQTSLYITKEKLKEEETRIVLLQP